MLFSSSTNYLLSAYAYVFLIDADTVSGVHSGAGEDGGWITPQVQLVQNVPSDALRLVSCARRHDLALQPDDGTQAVSRAFDFDRQRVVFCSFPTSDTLEHLRLVRYPVVGLFGFRNERNPAIWEDREPARSIDRTCISSLWRESGFQSGGVFAKYLSLRGIAGSWAILIARRPDAGVILAKLGRTGG